MHYFKLAPLFVYLLTTAVSARPLDQGIPLPVGDMTLGLVAPTAVPNVKLPDQAAAAARPTGVHGVPEFASVPGAGSSKSSGVSSVSRVAKPAKAVPLRRSPSPDPGPSHANPRLQPRMVREPDYAAANTNATIPVAPSTSTTKRELKEKEFRNGWVVPPPSTTSGSNHAKRASKHRSSKKKHSTAHHKKPSEAAQKPAHTDIAKPEHTTPAKPDLKAEHAAEDQQHSSASSSSAAGGPAAGFVNLVKTVGAAPNLLQPVGAGIPSVPDTPVTSADTGPTIDAADNTATDATQNAKTKVPVAEKVPAPPTDNANAYPAYTAPALPPPTATKAKRHSLVLDTDPLVPPSDETKEKKDGAFGVVNMDSNQKPPPPPPVPSVPAAKVPKPSVTAPPVEKVPIPSESLYQPSEPGYGGGYPTPTAVPV